MIKCVKKKKKPVNFMAQDHFHINLLQIFPLFKSNKSIDGDATKTLAEKPYESLSVFCSDVAKLDI